MTRAAVPATARAQDTRARILAIARDAVLAKGFDATSIEEIVAAAGITKGGFFYHFPDKNALARALIEQHVIDEDAIFDDVFGRAAELADDPLQRFLIGLKLLSEVLADMPGGHPGCLVATAAYQDRQFDASVRAANAAAVDNWRRRFRPMIDAIAERHPPRVPINLDALTDMVNGVVEGGIVLSKATGNPRLTEDQLMLFRAMVQLVFAPPQAR
jgi:AcrR family transcriptional regulator